MYDKSISIRDGNDKLAIRFYNYGSFCLWRLGDASRAIKLYRQALFYQPNDPELSFALAEALHLSSKTEMQRLWEKKRSDRDDDDDDDDDDDPPTWSNTTLSDVVDEATSLFECALETYDEDVAVILSALNFFVDAGDKDRAS